MSGFSSGSKFVTPISTTDTTASTTTGTGSAVLAGGLGVAGAGNFGGAITGTLGTFSAAVSGTTGTFSQLAQAPQVVPTAVPSTNWGIDFSSAGQISVPGSGSYTLAVGSGLVMMTDSAVTGQTGLYLIGGSSTGAAALLAGGAAYVAPTITPAASKYSVGFDGTNWRIYNGNVGVITFFVGLIRVRNTN